MGRRLAVLLACAVACSASTFAQTPPAAQPAAADGVTLLLVRFEALLQADREAEFPSLVSTNFPPEDVQGFAAGLFDAGTRRALVIERDRAPLSGALPGDGYRVVAELFLESAERARIITVLLDVRRPSGGAPDSWRITAAQAATSIDGLFRLRVNGTQQFTARNLTIAAEDLLLTLTDGSVFLVESEAGVTGLILFGSGVMRFTPAPETERGQMRIFAGADTLSAPFETAFVRVNPFDYEQRVSVASLTPAAVNPRDLRRAQEMLARDGPKSFSLDLRELSSDVWYLLPPSGDLLADVRTRRHGTLTYSRMATQSEDITLFDRERRRTIALYPSAQRRALRGLSFNEDDQRDYDVIDYDIEANIQPQTELLEGRTRLRLRMRTASASSLTLRLANDLVVRGVVSPEYGRLLHLRVREQNSVIVNFPAPLPRDTDVTLLVSYAGRVTPQEVEDESLQAGEGRVQEEPLTIPPEFSFLLSSRSYWYPQNPIPDYATATLRITVPEGFGCVASGRRRTGDEVTLRDLLTLDEGPAHVFLARDPLRYFAVVVSRFVRAAEATVKLEPGLGDPTDGAGISVAIDANPRQHGRGKTLIDDVQAIMRFYAGVVGEAPYSSLTVALVENELPGGHSPGYFAVLNNPVPASRLTWRNDPASFSSFPEFFLAHEIAHQWWGQAVGWRNYHEQWLSEGFAQYFAALYARHARGERVFTDMLRQFRRWAVAESEEGPISLGSRLGHLRGEPRVYRALVYNKSAAVLHMLRRLVGDEHFFTALRRFYAAQKFRKAGTDDLRAAFEEVAGRSLERFFDRWIYSADVPRLRYSTGFGGGTVNVQFEQIGSAIFDVPVTVTIVYSDGRMQDEVVPVTDRRVEWTVATERPVKQVQVNRDFAAVAVFERGP
ncbi:MAG: hypothetical protein HYU37_07675 [Acidobacteria bacterium]|nr:hypothetical protein [Acidobacteriota bacterium]